MAGSATEPLASSPGRKCFSFLSFLSAYHQELNVKTKEETEKNPFLAGADLGAVRSPAVERTGPVTVAAREAVLAVTGPVQGVTPSQSILDQCSSNTFIRTGPHYT